MIKYVLVEKDEFQQMQKYKDLYITAMTDYNKCMNEYQECLKYMNILRHEKYKVDAEKDINALKEMYGKDETYKGFRTR